MLRFTALTTTVLSPATSTPRAHQVSQRVHHDKVDQAEELRQPPALRPQARALHKGHAVVRHDAVRSQEAVHHLVQRRSSDLVNFVGKLLQ